MNEKLSQFNTPEETGVQSFQSSKMQDEINKVREEAIESTIAGLHFPETPKTKTIYEATNQENPYEIQREALSKLSLLDENLQPTDTYTNYINQGNSPIPGLEDQHDTLLFLDRQQEKIQQVQNGILTEDQMLMDLYGKDILELNGYNVMSVGWWQNKYHNNDFTSPFDNKYLMSQITEAARQHHNTLLAKQYTTTKVDTSHISTLLNKGDLSNEDIKTLFPELAEALNKLDKDKDLEWYISSNMISPSQRIYQAESGERYYLHTDGELYKLSNQEQGSKIAHFTEAEDGSIKEISLNSGDITDGLQEFKAGATSLITGAAKLVMGLWGSTIGYAYRRFTEGDWDWVDSITYHMANIDELANDHAGWLFDSGRIDMDGFKADDPKDWMMFGCNLTGMMVGGWVTGGMAQGVAGWGRSLATSAKTPIGRLGGKALEYTSRLYAMSTGNYKGYLSKADANTFTLFGKRYDTLFGRTIGGWAPQLNHMKTVGVYMTKDFQNSIAQMNQQRFQYRLANPDEELTNDNWKVLTVAASNALFNGFWSSIFAGGIDDNTSERWLNMLSEKKNTNVTTKYLTNFLTKYSVGVNNIAEFLDNSVTIYTGNIIGWDSDYDSVGDMFINNMFTKDENGNRRFDGANLFKSVVQGAVTTIPSAAAQLQRRNIAGEYAQAIWTKVLDNITAKENGSSKAEVKHTMRNLKASLISEFNSDKYKDQSLSQRIFSVLDEAHAKLKSGNKSIITKAISEVCNPKMMQVYKEMNDIAIESYNTYLSKQKDIDTTSRTRGLRKAFDSTVGEFFRVTFTQKRSALEFEKQEKLKDAFSKNLYSYFIQATNSAESEEASTILRRTIEITAAELNRVEEVYYNYNEFATKNKDEATKAHNAAEAKAKDLGVDVQVVKDSTKYFRLKNETDYRDLLNCDKAAMVLLTEFLPEVVYKIDDNTFGIIGSGNNLSNMFTDAVANKMLLSMHALGLGETEAAVDLYMKTVLGDDGFKYTVEKDKAATKELVEQYLNTAIDNGVISKVDAANFLLSLKDKLNTKSALHETLSKVFNTELTVKNVTKTGLTDLELYAVMYRAAMQLQDPNNNRFSGPTIAAEVLLNSESDIAHEIIKDLAENHLINPEFEKLYYDKLQEFTKEKLFKSATNKFFSDIVEVIGEEGVKLLSEQDLEGKDIKTFLKGYAKTKKNKEIDAKINKLIKVAEKLQTCEGVTFDGSKVTLNLTSYMHASVADFIDEVARTQPGSEITRENKGTYTEKPSNEDAETFLETSTRLVNSGKVMVTIDLDTADMNTIREVFNIMYNAKMFTDMVTREPDNVEEFKNYIQNYLTDIGKEFATTKKGTEYNTNIIDKKEAKQIVSNLSKISEEDGIARIREIDPNNKYVAEYDYYTLLKNNIEIKKISKEMSKLMCSTVDENGDPIGVVINPAEFGTETKDGLTISAFIKVLTGVKSKDGRTASKAGEKFAAINTDAKAFKVNKDMATKIMLNKFVDFLYDLPAIDVVVKLEDIKRLHDLGLINRDDSFYETVGMPVDGYYRLHLYKSKEAMKYYIETNKEINLYKILPFYSKDMIVSDINFNTPQAKVLGDIPDLQGRGLTTYTNVMGILNLIFEFDISNSLKTELFRNFFAAKDTLEFNPFSDENIELDMSAVRKLIPNEKNLSNIDVYKKYREGKVAEGVNDYLCALVETYKQLQNSYTVSNKEDNDDYKVWLHNPNVLKRMVKWAQSNTDVDTVIKETIKAYGDSTYRNTIGAYKDVGYTTADKFIIGGSYGVPSNIVGVDTIMSKSLLDHLMNIQYDLVDVDGKPRVKDATKQITKAYDYVKNMLSKHLTVQEMLDTVSRPVDKVFRIYEPSQVLQLKAIFGASEGQILIEDLDKLVRIEADAYNEFFEKLGMEKGYGERIYKRVLSLREKLLQFIGKSAEVTWSVSSNRKQLSLNPNISTTYEDSKNIAVGRYGERKNIRKYAGNFLKSNKDELEVNVTPDRLVDALAKESKEVARDMQLDIYNRKLSPEESYNKAYNERVQEVAIKDNADINGQTLVADITSDLALYRRLQASRNTKVTIDKMLNDLNIKIPKKKTNNILNYITDMVHRVSGLDYVSNWGRYSFFNPEDGTEFAMAVTEKVGSTVSHMDLLTTVLEHGDNLIGKIFMDFKKQDVNSTDGLSFGYKLIKDKQDLEDLKTDLYLKVIQENIYKADGHFSNAIDLINNMTQKELQAFMQKASRDNLGTVAKSRYLLSLMSETNIQVPYKYLIQPQNYKNDLLKNFIADHFNTAVGARWDSDPQVRSMFKAIIHGIDYLGLDDKHAQLVDKYFESMFMKYKDTYKKELYDINKLIKRLNNKLDYEGLTDAEWKSLRREYGLKEDSEFDDIVSAARRFILDNAKTPEVMSYIFNKDKSLSDMLIDYEKGMPEFYTLSDNSKLSIQDLHNFLQDGVKSSIRKIVFFDTESSNITKPLTGNKADSINDLFQISFVIYTKDEAGNLTKEQITKFIKHDNITNKDWIKANISKTDTFYKQNASYRKALDAYSKATEQDMITKEQVRDYLSGRLTGTPDAVIAYNGNNFEFKVLSEELAGVKTLDAMDTILKGYSDTTQKISQEESYKRTFSTDRGEKHTADQDTADMVELISKVTGLNISIDEDRSRLVLNLKNLLNLENDKLHSVLRQVDSFFKDENLEAIKSEFKDYEPTLDNIKTMQRAYNYLMNDMNGRALFEILDQLDNTGVYAQFVNLSTGQIDKTLTILGIKMLETEGNFKEAVHSLTSTLFGKTDDVENFENKSFKDFISMLGNNDELLLEKAGIDLDLKHNSQVQHYIRLLKDAFSLGEWGVKNKKIDIIDAEEGKSFSDNFLDMSYMTGAQSAIINNKDHISDSVRNDLINVFGSGMLSLKEGMDVSELQSRLDTTIKYNSPLIESLARQIDNILGESKGTGTFRGIYHMSISLSPRENNLNEIIYTKDGKLKRFTKDPETNKKYRFKLSNVQSGEIALTLRTLKDKLNITNLEDIRAEDGNLYILSITNPSDTMTPILPLRVRLIEGDQLSAGFTPDTQEILRNRDFDGDHTLTTTLTGGMKKIAPLLYKYMFSTYNVHSKLSDYLTHVTSSTDKADMEKSNRNYSLSDTTVSFLIGTRVKEIQDASIELDKILNEYKDEPNLPKTAELKIAEIKTGMTSSILKAFKEDPEMQRLAFNLGLNEEKDQMNFAKKAVEFLGVRSTSTQSSTPTRYVNNPFLYSKTIGDYETYTYTARKGSFARQFLEKSNTGDPIIGYYQKLLSALPIKSRVINNPMLDLYTPNIYMTDTLVGSIDTYVKTLDHYKNYLDNLEKFLKAEITTDKFSKATVDEYISEVKKKVEVYRNIDINTDEEGFKAAAKEVTMDTLWDLDFFIKRQAEPIQLFKEAIDKLSNDSEFKASLDKTLELDEALKKLTNEKEKVGSKYVEFSPYSDILSQDIVMNKVNNIDSTQINNDGIKTDPFDYGNRLFTSEDRKLQQLDDISNGFNKVNIFVTSGFSDSSRDTIGVTQNTKAKSISIEVWDKSKYNFNVKEKGSYGPNSVIGTDLLGNPITANKHIHIERVTGNNIIVDSEDTLIGKKLAAIGIAKGDSKPVTLKNLEDKDVEVDLVCDINNAFKNPDKLPVGINASEFFSPENMQYVKLKVNGKIREGYIIKNVPFNIIGSDKDYRTAMDTKDPASIRRFELMTTSYSQTLLGVGKFGDSVLDTNDNNEIIINFDRIQKAAETNFKNHDVNFADVGTNIMYYRSDALVNAMTEDEFQGFLNGLDGGIYKNMFTSKEDYLNNLRKSMFKINSEAALNEQLDMIYHLGKERFYDLVDSCELNQFIFGGLVNSLLNDKVPSGFTEEFFDKPRLPRSKSSAPEDYSHEEKRVVEGKVINESQRDARFANINHNTLLHVPANIFYKGLTGKNLNTNTIIRLHLRGEMSPRYHYANSANIDTDWFAIDTLRGVKYDDAAGAFVTADGKKTILAGEGDIFKIRNLDAGKWTRGSELDDMLDVEDTPHKANLMNLLYNSVDREYPTTGYSWATRLGYLLALGLDSHKNKLEKYATLRGVDSIEINKLTPQLINDANKMYYKAVINSNKVPIKDAMKTINSNTMGYTLRQDLKDFVPEVNLSKQDAKHLKELASSDVMTSAEQRIYEQQKMDAYKKAAIMLTTPKAEYANSKLQLTWDTSDKQIEWKTNWMSRSGIDARGAEQLSVDVGIKNYKASIPYIIQEYSEPLNKLKKFTNIIGTKEFEKFAKYQWLYAANDVDPGNFETRLSLMGETTESFKALKTSYDEFTIKYPEVVQAYNEHINNLMYLSKQASLVTNEPFSNNFIFMMPFVSTDKVIREKDVKSTIKSMASMSKYDPTTPKNVLQQNMAFNFFTGSERILRDLATVIASDNISKALFGEYNKTKDGNAVSLLDNKPILDEAFNIINDTDAITDMKPYTRFDSEITETVLNTVALYTDLNIKTIKRNSKNTQELLKNCFTSVRQEVYNLQAGLYPEFNKVLTLSEVYRIAQGDMSNSYNKAIVDTCEKLYQAMYGEIIIAQRIMETDKYASNRLNNYINSLFESGKVLVNKFGQKIERNGVVAPTDRASFGYLKENIEIAMNSKTPDMFNQYLLEKALSGELYIMDKDLADQLEKHVWTAPVSNRVQKVLQKASSIAASIQMSLPHKMLGRLIRYTGTDYAIGVVANTEVASYIPQASTEISAAIHSDGEYMSDDLKGYLQRLGQPSLGNKPSQGIDPLDPTIKLNTVTEKLTRPLEWQNHQGRYAIYLAALEGFRRQEAGEGEAWYGSQYYNKEAIDQLASNEDKAMYVMDFMLGSPGGFPALSKKTSGYLMYATFPMNLTRTGGAYLMSMGKLFKEGITEENKTQWYNNVVMPGLGMVGLSVLSNAILTAVCDYYDIDEETEEEWKREGVTLDPIGTLIGGTPSVVYDSINPANQFKEMFINPFTNKYNDTMPKKAYGWMKANILSRLNPMAKIPIELTTGKDLWGDTAEGFKNAEGLFETNKKYQYTNIENGMKKVYGLLVGSGIANGIVDEIKMDSYDPEDPSLLNSIWKGFAKGLSYDMGNQKTWKKNTSNYYAILTDMKTYGKSSKDVYGNTYGDNYYYDIEELTDADKLEYARKYGSRYGEFNELDYNRVNAMIKKMIQNHVNSSTLYNYIVKEYNENNVSEATLRSALNNNSIIRKLRMSSMSGYTKTLKESELVRLQKAIDYENTYYPILQKLFPEQEYSNSYVPYYKKATYYDSGSSSSYPSYSTPRNYYYYPGKYYPKTFSYNKKTGRYGPDIERVQVNVSPQMAIWNQDNNLTRYETGINAENEPKWLRDKDYVSRVN